MGSLLLCLVAVFCAASVQALVPGPPTNLQVKEQGPDYITVTFNDPELNPESVDVYGITWLKNEADNHVTFKSNAVCNPVCEDTIYTLPGCSNITIAVAASNFEGVMGEPAFVDTATEDAAPLALPSVGADAMSPTVIEVSWTGNPDDECAYAVTICWIDDITAEENCEDVILGDGDGSGSFNITGVLPCNRYDITVTAKSITGLENDPVHLSQFTQDIEPNPVTNLIIEDVEVTDVTFSYDLPTENPQCALNIEDIYIDLTHQDTWGYRSPLALPNSRVYKDGLLPCTDYMIMVRTISRTGITSRPENVTFTTKAAEPSSPEDFTATDIQMDSVVLEWIRPKNNSRCVDEYQINVSDEMESHDFTVYPEKDGPIKIEYPVAGLSPCTDYEALVTAVSSEGDSDLASTSFQTLC